MAAKLNLIVPEAPVMPKFHRIDAVINSYLDALRLNRRPLKSINATEFELKEFAKFCKKLYVEQINREDLFRYRNHLTDEGYASVTTLNKVLAVCTWLKKNPVISITGLMKTDDWKHKDLKKPETTPRPYKLKEQKAMLAVATPEEHLLIRFFLGTGCREQEVSHAELSDILEIEDSDVELAETEEGKVSFVIQIQKKTKWDWTPKTDKGTRQIPLGDDLVADLKKHCSGGLLFPHPTTGKPQGHFLRVIKTIAEKAGVAGATLHRFRDTYATEQVHSGNLSLREIARRMGHKGLDMMDLYADYDALNSKASRDAANAADRFGAKPGPQLVKAG
jgi:integrase